MTRAAPPRFKRSSHPIYPRPVSPLHYEPLHVPPEDVLFVQDSQEESNTDEEVRVAKRRRIEKLGEQYLRGDGLFILTAGIKGPLGERWVNPWKKTRRKGRKTEGLRSGQSRREVPETVERPGRVETAEIEGEKAESAESEVAVDDEAAGGANQMHPDLVVGKEDRPKRQPIHNDPFISGRNQEPSGTSEGDDKTAWLKKNNAGSTIYRGVYPQDPSELNGSPSTRTGQLRPAGKSPLSIRQQDEPPRSERGEADSFDGKAETIIKRLRRTKVSGNAPSNAPQENVIESECRDRPVISPSRPRQLHSVECNHPSARILSEDGVQYGAVNGSPSGHKMVVQNLPSPPAEDTQDSLDNQNQVMPEEPVQIELRSNGQPDTASSLSNQSPINQSPGRYQQDLMVELRSDSHNTSERMPPPTLHTETTNTTAVSTIPSAQVETTAQVLPPSASLPSTGDKLSEQTHSDEHDHENSFQQSTQAAIAAAHRQMQKELATQQPPPASRSGATTMNAAKSKSKSGITPFSAFNGPDSSSPKRYSLNTQELIDAVTPFDLASTVKKAQHTRNRLSSSPTIMSKKDIPKRARARKRASFAPEATGFTASNSGSSQGSIKVSLRVTKNTVDVPATAEGKSVPRWSPGPSAFGKLGLDMETSCSGEDDHTCNSGRDGDDTTSMIPTSKPTTNASSRTTGQDAQRVAQGPVFHRISLEDHGRIPDSVGEGHAAGEEEGYGDGDGDSSHEADFDLSAAMDEVGSFLQSWDTEREVKELGRKEGLKGGREGGRKGVLRNRGQG